MNKRITIPSALNNVKDGVSEILALLKEAGAEDSDIFDIRLSLEESLINAIKYGNKLNERQKVLIDFSCGHDSITIIVEDEGRGFDHHALPDPTKEENLLKPRGRGVFLIKHLMDKVEFNKKGNRITMTKHLKKKGLPTA